MNAFESARARVRPAAARAVRGLGTWALDRLGQWVLSKEALPGFVPEGPAAQLSPDVLAIVDAGVARYRARFPNDTYAETAARIDRVRYAQSLAWARTIVRPGMKVLELGGEGLFSFLFREAFPDVELVSAGFDLRRLFPFEDKSFDALLCMEVIEHVCDVEYAHATTLSGVRNCLSEARRVLKLDGTMLLTTPNAAAAWVLHRALRHEPPWVWEYHFREFTLFEIVGLVEQAGLQVARRETVNAWSQFGTSPTLLGFVWLTGASIHARGDNIFLIARRTT